MVSVVATAKYDANASANDVSDASATLVVFEKTPPVAWRCPDWCCPLADDLLPLLAEERATCRARSRRPSATTECSPTKASVLMADPDTSCGQE
jgi:hypothetical protein